jgi:uncharacterized protein (TIGR02646 family)
MSEMIIESLHVKNVRLFTELNIDFNPRFNFLAGPNGCGKTSALACVSHCFQQNYFEYSRYGNESEFWSDITKDGIKYRLGLDKGSLNENEYRKNSLHTWIQPPTLEGRTSIASYQVKDILKLSPLFIGARRNIHYQEIQGIQREKPFEEAIDDYLNNNIRSLYGEWQTNIKQWIVNRYFMSDKAWAVQEKQNWNHFITQLPKIAPFNSNFSYVETWRDFEPVFSIYGKECYLEELSAGYQAVLSLIIDIFAWIESTMEGDSRIATNARGTVLIDEPDVHLHPEWHYKEDAIRTPLFERSHQKCAYCECKVADGGYLEVDHFMPKSLYPQSVFEWSNLLPSCGQCNRYKLDHDTGEEAIINPYEIDPDEAFYYKSVAIKVKDGAYSEMAAQTIEVCRLNRDPLLDARSRILPKLTKTSEALETAITGYNNAMNEKDKNKFLRNIREAVSTVELTQQDTETYAGFCRHFFKNDDIYKKAKELLAA